MIETGFVPMQTITDFKGLYQFQIQPITEIQARRLIAALQQRPLHTIRDAEMASMKKRGWYVGNIIGVDGVYLYWGIIHDAPALTRVILVAETITTIAA